MTWSGKPSTLRIYPLPHRCDGLDLNPAAGAGTMCGMRVLWIIIGAVAVIVGAVWTLQGLDVLGGSRMSGDSTWAIVGPIVAAVGLLVLLFGARKRGAP